LADVARSIGATWLIVVSRAWRKVKVDWDAWMARDLTDEDIVWLILDGTVIKTRLDRKATNISVLAAIGVRRPSRQIASQSPVGQWAAWRRPGIGCSPSRAWTRRSGSPLEPQMPLLGECLHSPARQ